MPFPIINQRNLRDVLIDLKLNNLDLSRNTTEFETLPTRQRAHHFSRYNTFAMESVRICHFKNIFGGNFCTENLVSVLLSYSAIKWV